MEPAKMAVFKDILVLIETRISRFWRQNIDLW